MKKINLTKKQMIIAGAGITLGIIGAIFGIEKVKDSKEVKPEDKDSE